MQELPTTSMPATSVERLPEGKRDDFVVVDNCDAESTVRHDPPPPLSI